MWAYLQHFNSGVWKKAKYKIGCVAVCVLGTVCRYDT